MIFFSLLISGNLGVGKSNPQVAGNIETSSQALTLQTGLPPAVEAKRQEIYNLAVKRDYNGLAKLRSYGDFERIIPVIISVLNKPYGLEPRTPPDPAGKHQGFKAEYKWPSDSRVGDFLIMIREDGRITYFGEVDI